MMWEDGVDQSTCFVRFPSVQDHFWNAMNFIDDLFSNAVKGIIH